MDNNRNDMKKSIAKNKKQGRGLTKTFAFGGVEFDDTNEALFNSQKNVAKATLDTMNDEGLNTAKIIATMAQTIGGMMMSAGGKGNLSAGQQGLVNMNSQISGLAQQYAQKQNAYSFADGGKVPVEVEGNEVGQLPNGMMLNFQGPSHENGGIPVDLPSGTKIYSDRVSIDGKTMAQRKKSREIKINNLQKKIDKGDKIAQGTLERYLLTAGKEEQLDMNIQKMIKNVDSNREFGKGGIVKVGGKSYRNGRELQSVGADGTFYFDGKGNVQGEGTDYNSIFTGPWGIAPAQTTAQKSNTGVGENPANSSFLDSIENIFNSGPTAGDMAGLYGTLHGAYAGKKNTLAEKASDTPNVNHFKFYGQEGLKTLDQSKKFAKQIGDIQRSEIELHRKTATDQNRKTARSINTMRALDLASQNQANRLDMNIYQNEAAQLQAILNQEAVMKNQIDQVVMGGEQARDIADRQDKAHFYSNLTKDEQTIGKGWEAVGHNLNKIKERNSTINAMNNSYSGFQTDANGKITGNPAMSTFVSNLDYKTIPNMTKEDWDKMNEGQKIQSWVNYYLKGGK